MSANAREQVEGAQGIHEEAERITAEILAQDDESDGLADLFANLPTEEVDKETGRTSTVVHGPDGVKITIRDFGKWTGVSPMRALEEACRSRYVPAVRFGRLVC